MYYFIDTDGIYINAVGISNTVEPHMITELEYQELCELMEHKPVAPIGKTYKLTLNKNWMLEDVNLNDN